MTRKALGRITMGRVFVAACALLVGVGGASSVSAEKTLKTGALFAMTGAGAFYGKVMNQGAFLAMEEINAAGGVGGVKLEMIVEDHLSGDARAAASAGQKLINVDRVPWIFTSYSAPTLSVQPMAAAGNVLMMNGGGVSSLMLNKPYLYSTRLLSNVSGRALADYCWKLGYRKMAMIHWSDPAGMLSADAGEARWKELGGKIVAAEAHEKGATDYFANLAKIKAAKPDVLAAIGSWQKDVGFIAKQARDMGIKVPIVGVDWSPDNQAIAGDAFEGYRYIIDFFDVNGSDPWTQRFVAAYEKR
jgi:branched-chain amino acid transport system substrate-binding protein